GALGCGRVRAVLAKPALGGGDRRRDRLAAEGFEDRDQRDVGGGAPGVARRRFDLAADGGQPFGGGGKGMAIKVTHALSSLPKEIFTAGRIIGPSPVLGTCVQLARRRTMLVQPYLNFNGRWEETLTYYPH